MDWASSFPGRQNFLRGIIHLLLVFSHLLQSIVPEAGQGGRLELHDIKTGGILHLFQRDDSRLQSLHGGW